MKKVVKILIWVIVIAAAVYGVISWQKNKSAGSIRYALKSESIVRGNISRTISASGTVEPEELINVGAQVNGKIMSFGIDADGKRVDYRSRVKAGMVLAQIDEVLYDAELRKVKAEILQAKAAVATANANIRQTQARQKLAELNWKRAQELYSKHAMAKSDYDNAESSWLSALADSTSAEAQLRQAEAQMAIADAALIKAQRNMDYCVITSPVDGIIIDRRVSIGQTVVSNMSASSIFLIAKEFKKMQIWVSVNEADIGTLKPGMPVEFTVDAFPGTTFYGEVQKIRLNATMSQNVVTYIVEVITDNSDGKLLPYLTANVKFIIAERKDVLSVSNAALRFHPPQSIISDEGRKFLADGVPEGHRLLWLKDDKNKVAPIAVKTGMNAGSRTEIISDTLKPGDEVVFAAAELKEDDVRSGDTRSPFMPKPPQNARRRGSGSAADRARAVQNAK